MTTPAEPTVVVNTNPDQSKEAIAPERTPEVSKPKPTPEVSFTPEQQKVIAAIISERLEKVNGAKKTVEQQLEELRTETQTKLEQAERRALNAVVSKYAAATRDPELVLQVLDTEGLSADDETEIAKRVAALVESKPYLAAEPAATGPNLTPAPGTGASTQSRKLYTAEEMARISPEELASDETKMKLYLESLDALG